MFKKILLVYSDKETLCHLESLREVEFILKNKGLNFEKVCVNDFEKSFLEGVDLVISVGGDGTFIRSSHYLSHQILLGINSDSSTSEGGLCSLNENSICDLESILSGEFNLILRNRVSIYLNNKKIEERALNEVYVGAKNQFHTSRYIIDFLGEKEEHRSSGVLVSTGSGSRAWFKSAGGTPFDFGAKKLKFLVREPFIGRLFSPKILRGEIVGNDEMVFVSKHSFGGVIAIDSNVTYDFNKGDRVCLKLSQSSLNVLIKKN